MKNSSFQFKQFIIHQDRCAMKVTTDACLFGGWMAEKVKSEMVKGETSNVKKVLDVGAGTGLLSLMFAQKNPTLEIDAIEIDHDAFEQAKENVAISPFANQVHLIHADVRTFSFEKKYDIIISNPPFYEDELKGESNKKNIAHHSEQLGLSELFHLIKNNLTDAGEFFLLLPYKRHKEISKLITKHGFFAKEIVFARQSTSHHFFRIMVHGSLSTGPNTESATKEISIWNDQQQYTNEFVQLLRDYYLYL